MRKLTQSYRIEIQQITFYFANLLCENLCYLRAFDTTPSFYMDELVRLIFLSPVFIGIF